MQSKYNVLIIGGGPGGAMAGKAVAEAGLTCCIIEKRPAIGAPVRCAEGVGQEISELVDLDPKWISSKINGAQLVAPDGQVLELNPEMAGNEVGYVLDRKIFDRELVWKAANAGCDVFVKSRASSAIIRDGKVCGAVIETGGKTVEVLADIVIAADGVESKFARWCGIDTTVPMAEIETCVQYLMTDIDIDSGLNAFYLGRDVAPEGYVWIFSKGEKTANVGIGISGKMCKDGKRPKDYLDAFIAEHLPNGKIIELMAGGVSACKPLECTVADGLIIVGDAARLSDPITGGGIINAMYTGKLAGEVAAESIAAGDCSKKALMRYDTEWRCSKMGKGLKRNYQVKEIFIKLKDEKLNSIVKSVNKLDMEIFDTKYLIRELVKYNPWLLKDIGTLRRLLD
ncbi:NAD(P)/FAD-dependent oxidoreductase [Methanogenium cariaci]|jgi:digeranylgeranylglycerophospholipid reductase